MAHRDGIEITWKRPVIQRFRDYASRRYPQDMPPLMSGCFWTLPAFVGREEFMRDCHASVSILAPGTCAGLQLLLPDCGYPWYGYM
jgi:hypothetical protein